MEKLFFFLSLMEVRFVLAILLTAAAVDILKRLIIKARRLRRRYKDVEGNSILAIYHDSMQSGRYANGVRQFRVGSDLPNGYKEV